MNSIGDIESTHELLKKIRNGKISNDVGGNCCDCYIEEPYIESLDMDVVIDKPKKTKKTKQPKQPKQPTIPQQQTQPIQLIQQQIKEPKKTKKVKEPKQPIPQEAPIKLSKKDNDLYILTDKGRYVLKAGSIGKSIIKKNEDDIILQKEQKKLARLKKKQEKEQLKK